LEFSKYKSIAGKLLVVLLFSYTVTAQCPRFDCPEAENWDRYAPLLSFKQNSDSIDKGIFQAKQDHNIACEANWLRRLGMLHQQSGNFDKACEAYLGAAVKSEKMGDRTAMASNYNQLGGIYYVLKDHVKSLRYFKSALVEFEGCKFEQGIADIAGNIAEIYLETGNIPQAFNFAAKSLTARRKLKNPADIGYNYYTYASIFDKQNTNDSAGFYYDQALTAFALNKDVGGMISSLNAKAGFFLKRNQTDSALVLYLNAYDSAGKYQELVQLVETFNGLVHCYELKKDSLTAFKYLKLRAAISDTLLNLSTIKTMIDAERKYDSEKKEREIALQKVTIDNQHLMLIVFIILLVSVICITILLIMQGVNRKKLASKEIELHRRKVDELLQSQEVENVNAILKGQNLERKRIAQDLHDRLGSILATVKLHFTNIEDAITQLHQQQNKSYTEANLLLDEACEEVRRVSHDLYEGSLDKFGFKTALTQLIAAIEKTNALQITFIENNVNEKDMKVYEKDLYRITQELLSNTLKYADATQVTIQLNLHAETFEYLYEDNGKGFDKNKLLTNSGIGYKNILSRVESMKATWSLDTSVGHGMTLNIEIPVV
jgi:two-component system NarL family sensor kinase